MITPSRRVLAVAILALAVPSAFAQKADCPTPMGDRVDSAEDKISSWTGLFDWYCRYEACDDEKRPRASTTRPPSSSEVSGELMRAAPIVDEHPDLRRFLLRHIDAVAMSAEQARALEWQARSNCPPANAALCRDTARESDATVKETTP